MIKYLFLLFLIPNLVFASAVSPVIVQDNELAIIINTKQSSGAFSSGAKDSLTDWSQRTINNLLQDVQFQQLIENKLNELFNDPNTPYHDALFDTQVEVPLAGAVNLGFHIQDLPNTFTGCGLPISECSNPSLKFLDSDTDSFTIDWNSTYILLSSNGPANESLPLIPSVNYEGDVEIEIHLGNVVADIWLRQPDMPLQNSFNTYVHGYGRILIPETTIIANLYSIGGDLRNRPVLGGYGIGLDVTYLYAESGFAIDVEPIDCSITLPSISANSPLCDKDDLANNHPLYSDPQISLTTETNNKSEFLSNVITFLESNFFIEAERTNIAAIDQYLTAIEILDTSNLTHEHQPLTPPIITHPFQNDSTLAIDYGFKWRFDASENGVALVGGLGLDMSGDCYVDSIGTFPIIDSIGEITYAKANTANAMVGAAIHNNVFNRLVHNIWKSGAACIKMDKNTYPQLESFLKANNLLVGGLNPYLRDRSIMVKFVPSFTNWNQPYNQLLDQPYVEEATETSFAAPFDQKIVFPHYKVEFYIDSVGDGEYISYTKIFETYIRVEILWGLGWYKSTFSELPVGHYCKIAPYPCRVARLGFRIDSELEQIVSIDSSVMQKNSFLDSISHLLGLALGTKLETLFEAGLNSYGSPSVALLGIAFDSKIGTGKGMGIGYVDADNGIDNDKDYLGIYLGIADLNNDGYSDVLNTSFLIDIFQPAINMFAPITISDNKVELGNDTVYYQIDNGLLQIGNKVPVSHLDNGEHFIMYWEVNKDYISSAKFARFEIQNEKVISESIDNSIGCSVSKNNNGLEFLLILGLLFYMRKRI